MRHAPEEGELRIPDAPRIETSLRDATSDFYFNSWRLVPANAIWGLGFALFIFLLLTWLPAALLVLVLLALPTAGIFRLAALLARERPIGFSDSLDAWRAFLRPALLTGAVIGGTSVVLVFNILIGLSSGEPIGWAFGTMAGWGLVAVWVVALAFWPLLVDPAREDEPLLDRLRLAAMIVLSSPLRFGGLLLVLGAVLAVSFVLFAALLTITIAFIALVLARFVLPAADRLEGRRTKLVAG